MRSSGRRSVHVEVAVIELSEVMETADPLTDPVETLKVGLRTDRPFIGELRGGPGTRPR